MKIDISSVEGNTQKLDGGAMFGNAPRAMWEKWVEVDDQSRIDLACRSFLCQVEPEGGEKPLNILLEAGIGACFPEKLAERYGVQNSNNHLLKQQLEKNHGLSCDDIDYVILSHLHFDHVGGLLEPYQEGKEQGLIFENASYIVSEKALDRALNPHPRDKASYLPNLNRLLKESGRLIVIPKEEHAVSIFPGSEKAISFFYSEGHTPGQLHTILTGESRRAIFCGDLVPGEPWVHEALSMGYDRHAELVIDEKRSLYQQSIPEHWIHLFTHDTKQASAVLTRNPKGKVIVDKNFREPLGQLQKLRL